MPMLSVNRFRNAFNFGRASEVYNNIVHSIKARQVYKETLNEFCDIIYEDRDYGEQMIGNYVFVLWFQGEANAPPVVKMCINSTKKMFNNLSTLAHNYEVVVLDDNNLKDFIKLPGFIEKKYNNGMISRAHYSDIIRTYLLKRYGGIWIDSTCLSYSTNMLDIFDNYDLFLYKSADCLNKKIRKSCISSWFIYSKANNPIISKTYDILCEYWKNHNSLDYYFKWHIVFSICANEMYKEEFDKMPFVSNHNSNYNLKRVIYKKYNKERFENCMSSACFHKLDKNIYCSYKKSIYKHLENIYA